MMDMKEVLPICLQNFWQMFELNALQASRYDK